MPDKDINIHVRAKDTEETNRKLKGVGRSARRVGDETAKSHKHASRETDKATRSLSNMTQTCFVGARAIISGVTKAIQIQNEALREHAEIVTQQQNKLLRLQFLGSFFKERPELRQQVQTYAEFGRRPFEEVADAWYNLRSKGAGLTQPQKDSIMREALEFGRTDPSAPLDTLVDMFSLYAKQTRQRDANRIQNVLSQTITEAGGSTADVARYMPQFLPIGMSGGLTGPQAAGLWSYVTTQLADASIATTGLRSTFMGLQGRGSPEGQKFLQRAGITSGMGFMEKIQRLSQMGLTLGQAEQIAGREGAPVFLSLLRDPQAMLGTISNVVGADRPDLDITRSNIEQLMSQDEIARMEEDMRLLAVSIQGQKAKDTRALQWGVHKRKLEQQMREQGVPEYQIRLRLWGEGLKPVLGYEEPGDFEDRFAPLSHTWQASPGGPGAGVTVRNHYDYSTHYHNGELPKAEARFSQD